MHAHGPLRFPIFSTRFSFPIPEFRIDIPATSRLSTWTVR